MKVESVSIVRRLSVVVFVFEVTVLLLGIGDVTGWKREDVDGDMGSVVWSRGMMVKARYCQKHCTLESVKLMGCNYLIVLLVLALWLR
jgi:hypothetical protein